MNSIHAAVLIGLTITSTSSSAIPKQDVVECALRSGKKFVLTSNYDWSPLAKKFPGIVSERLNKTPFRVAFQERNSESKQEIESLGMIPESVNLMEGAEKLCQNFGEKNDIPYGGSSHFRPSNATFFTKIKLDSRFRLTIFLNENPEKLRVQLEHMDAVPSVPAISQFHHRLVSELALIDSGGVVVGVFRSESHDGGKTWPDPEITTKADIFEIGKRLHEQSFIARPVKINGKEVKAKFPPHARR